MTRPKKRVSRPLDLRRRLEKFLSAFFHLNQGHKNFSKDVISSDHRKVTVIVSLRT